MALKNAYSKMPINRIFDRLQKTLAEHGAKQILFEYGDDGKVYGLTFIVKLKERFLPIKLPARISNVKQCLLNQGFSYKDEQVYRIAWRNILDWIEAQMAFIDTEQTKLEEIFLPHMTDRTGRTFFEKMKDNQFLLPDST